MGPISDVLGLWRAFEAVLWPQLPKVALFGPKNRYFLARNHFFVASLQKIVTIMTAHLKDNLFVLTAFQGGLPSRSRLGPKLTQKFDFLYIGKINHLLGLSRTRLNAIITIVLFSPSGDLGIGLV